MATPGGADGRPPRRWPTRRRWTSSSPTAGPVPGLNAQFDADGDLPRLRTRYTVDKTQANADFTLGTVSVKYRVRGTGFADLTDVPGAFHLVHLHSQFESNIGQPIPQQLNGPFFTGDPGDPIPSVPPPADAADRLGDPGYLNFLEGARSWA